MKKVDPFAQAPEFLAAFNNVASNGFFEEIKFDAGSRMCEGDIFLCSIQAWGCIPNHKKYLKEGCGALIDPQAVITSCKAVNNRRKVKNVSVTVETKDWLLYDKEGEHVIGSKGLRTEMRIIIQFVV